MAKLNCANCYHPYGEQTGKAQGFVRQSGIRLCKDIMACNKRRAKIDEDRYGKDI